jgi:hypothetical protein
MKKHRILFKTLIVAAAMGFITRLSAQPPMPNEGHAKSNNQQGTPLDGGVGLLLMAGTLYAARKIYRHGKTDDQEDSANFAKSRQEWNKKIHR